MGETLFRGKTEKGEWVYGFLFVLGEGTEYAETYILGHLDHRESVFDIWKCAEKVVPETVGLDTGFKDKNGNKIFEGDIISTRKDGIRTKKLKGYFGVDSEGYPQKVPGYDGYTEYHYNCTEDCLAVVRFSPRNGFYLEGTTMFVDAICNEIVGNIHDNPELLRKD